MLDRPAIAKVCSSVPDYDLFLSVVNRATGENPSAEYDRQPTGNKWQQILRAFGRGVPEYHETISLLIGSENLQDYLDVLSLPYVVHPAGKLAVITGNRAQWEKVKHEIEGLEECLGT